MTRRPPSRLLAAALAAAVLSACSGSSSTPAPPTPPSVTLRPSDGFLLNIDRGGSVQGEPLAILFGGGMQRATVVVTGSVAGDVHSSAWSTRAAADDTLTLTLPAGASWTAGSGRTLHAAGTAASGAAVSADFTLDVGSYRPVVTAVPSPPALTTNQPVVLAFAFEADPATLVLGGALPASVHLVTWATDHGSVTLAPTTAWASLAGQDLTVAVTSVHSAALAASGTFTYDVAGTSPGGALVPASGSLAQHGAIQAVFTTTMDQASLSLGGTLAGSAAPATWSATVHPDDTLTLTPAAAWPGGAQTLTVDATDLAGHPLVATLAGSYAVTVDAACGTAGGACVNATDCAFTMLQLGGWTYGCFVTNLGSPASVPACIEANGVTAGCATCAAAYATCAGTNCLTPCQSGLSSPTCTSCLDASGCTAAFTTCGGRTP